MLFAFFKRANAYYAYKCFCAIKYFCKALRREFVNGWIHLVKLNNYLLLATKNRLPASAWWKRCCLLAPDQEENRMTQLLWLSTEAVAFFSLPILSLFSLPACSLVSSRIVILERLSLHCSSKPQNWIIMDLINWSLNAIDTIFSTRSTGSGEPNCPDGTYPAGYTMDAWDRWRIVCLAALSVEDIEDVYLFGTMITGLLLIGLGFALGYRRIKETGTAVQSLTRLPVMIEAVGRAVSIETETINRNMDSITEKLTALQRKIDGDQNGQWELAVKLECGYSS